MFKKKVQLQIQHIYTYEYSIYLIIWVLCEMHMYINFIRQLVRNISWDDQHEMKSIFVKTVIMTMIIYMYNDISHGVYYFPQIFLANPSVFKAAFSGYRNWDVYLSAIVKISGTLQKQSNYNPTRMVKCIFMPCLDICVLVSV